MVKWSQKNLVNILVSLVYGEDGFSWEDTVIRQNNVKCLGNGVLLCVYGLCVWCGYVQVSIYLIWMCVVCMGICGV